MLFDLARLSYLDWILFPIQPAYFFQFSVFLKYQQIMVVL